MDITESSRRAVLGEQPASASFSGGKTKFGDATRRAHRLRRKRPRVSVEREGAHRAGVFGSRPPGTARTAQSKFRGHAPPLGVMPTSSIPPDGAPSMSATEKSATSVSRRRCRALADDEKATRGGSNLARVARGFPDALRRDGGLALLRNRQGADAASRAPASRPASSTTLPRFLVSQCSLANHRDGKRTRNTKRSVQLVHQIRGTNRREGWNTRCRGPFPLGSAMTPFCTSAPFCASTR